MESISKCSGISFLVLKFTAILVSVSPCDLHIVFAAAGFKGNCSFGSANIKLHVAISECSQAAVGISIHHDNYH